MSRKTSERISHEDVKTMRRVVAWLDKINRLDPLQSAVGHDLADVADEALKSRAIVHIRSVNLGRPKPAAVNLHRPPPTWTVSEMEELQRFWRAGMTIARIAETLGKPEGTVNAYIGRLGLFGSRTRPRPQCVEGYNTNPRGPLARARAVMQARKQREREDFGEVAAG